MTMKLWIGAIALSALAAACTSPTPAAGSTASARPPMTSASIVNSCINPSDITGQTIVSDQEIRFDLKNGEAWSNRLPQACAGLKLSGGFSWVVHGMLVCSNQQRINVKETGTPCLLGEFSRLPKSPS